MAVIEFYETVFEKQLSELPFPFECMKLNTGCSDSDCMGFGVGGNVICRKFFVKMTDVSVCVNYENSRHKASAASRSVKFEGDGRGQFVGLSGNNAVPRGLDVALKNGELCRKILNKSYGKFVIYPEQYFPVVGRDYFNALIKVKQLRVGMSGVLGDSVTDKGHVICRHE